MSIEGKLKIQLQTDSGRVAQVQISSTRPVYAAKVFRGKPVREAQRSLPLLFSICGTAQACASARACERAMGLPLRPGVEQVRNRLVNMETVREHLWRILLDWPALLGEAPQQAGMAGLLSLQQAFRQALTGGVDPFVDADRLPRQVDSEAYAVLVEKIAHTLEQQVFGISPVRWLTITSIGELEKWLEQHDTVASRLINCVLRNNWEKSGCSEVEPLPDLAGDALIRLTQNEAFAARPQWRGHCCESTSLTRCSSPLLNQLKREYSNGLLPRLIARLSEMAQLVEQLGETPLVASPVDYERATPSAQNPGVGQVSAARGQLVHRVELDGEVVVDYQIVAPTEWNFHPQGVVAGSLGNLRGDNMAIEQQARFLVNAIDPCVAFDLGVN